MSGSGALRVTQDYLALGKNRADPSTDLRRWKRALGPTGSGRGERIFPVFLGLFGGERAAQGHAHDVAVAQQGELDRVADVAGQGLVDATLV